MANRIFAVMLLAVVCAGLLLCTPAVAGRELMSAQDFSTPSNRDYNRIFLKNNYKKDVDFAINYDTNLGSDADGDRYVTSGYWTLKPGERKYVVDTKNRNIYVYAEATDGSAEWSSNDKQSTGPQVTAEYKGDMLAFRHRDIGIKRVDYTYQVDQ